MGGDVKVGVKMLGVEELAAGLHSMDQEVRRKGMRAVLYEGAKVYASEVKHNAPVDSGLLAMSIKPKPVTVDWDNPHAGVTIDTKRGGAWYWHFVEWGTKAIGAGQIRYSTGVVNPRVAGQRKRGGYDKSGHMYHAHHATAARAYIRPAGDSFYTRHEWEQRGREILSTRIAAWKRKQARATKASHGAA